MHAPGAGIGGELRVVDADPAQEAVERVGVAGGDRDLGQVAFALLLGSRKVCGLLNGLSWQAVTWESVTCRRHFPIWMTSGTLVPCGAL